MIINIPSSKASGFIKSTTEPTGVFKDGTIWYNPDTEEFKTYVVGEGFKTSGSSEIAFSRYQNIYTIPENVDTETDISIPINIEDFNENDILEVVYEGLILDSDSYDVSVKESKITLKQFTAIKGEKVLFIVTRIQKASNVTSVTADFKKHIEQTASGTIEGHVKLSDELSENDSTSGIAATPKAVLESQLIKDDGTDKKYKIGIANGLLYIKEVE